MLNKGEWGQDWSLGDVASSSSLLVLCRVNQRLCRGSLWTLAGKINSYETWARQVLFGSTSAGIRSLYSAWEAWQGHCWITCVYLSDVNFWGNTGIGNSFSWAILFIFNWDVLTRTLPFQRPRLVWGIWSNLSLLLPTETCKVLCSFSQISFTLSTFLFLCFLLLSSPLSYLLLLLSCRAASWVLEGHCQSKQPESCGGLDF